MSEFKDIPKLGGVRTSLCHSELDSGSSSYWWDSEINSEWQFQFIISMENLTLLKIT